MSEQKNQDASFLNFPRASMYTPAPGKDNERASINWGAFNENPRITVWTRIDDDEVLPNGKKKGPISAGIGHEAMEMIHSEAISFYRSGKKDILIFDNYGRPIKDDGTSAFEKVVQSSLIIGRNDEGICYYGLRSADESRPVIMFEFRGYEWHKPRRRSEPFSLEELSTIHAVGMWSYFKKCTDSIIRGQTDEERAAASERWKKAREARGGNKNWKSNKTPSKAGDTLDSGFEDGGFTFG